MERKSDSRTLIDAAAKARFLAALHGGATRAAAAAAAGFRLGSLYTARRRDPLFRLAWLWAMELRAAAELAACRRAAAARRGEEVPVRIAPQGNRPLQRRRMGWVKFTEERQQIFLDHFAGTADAQAAAAEAGICYATVRKHRRNNPDFAATMDETLREAVAGLEAEMVRQRLEMQRRLRENLEPKGEMPAEFERVMKVLARWDRRDGRVGPRELHHGKQRRYTFEQAMAILDKKLRSLGLRHGIPGDQP